MKLRAAVTAAGISLSAPAAALATYSIVGSDLVTQQTGGAGTSCLMGSDVYIIYGAAPGRGAVHAQARANQAGRDRAVQLLEQGMAPADVIAAITAPSFDASAASRQYGVIDVAGRSAGFTGSSTLPFADDMQGRVGSFTYSVQGNILTGAAVLTQAAAAFEQSGACDLAERLMRALEAGADNGEGDSRCTDSLDIPADSAFLQVEAPNTQRGSFLSLRVRTSGRDNPMLQLRSLFDEWRATHPCPAGSGGSGGAGGGGGSIDAGATSAGAANAGGAGASTSAGASGAPVAGRGGSATGGAGMGGTSSPAGAPASASGAGGAVTPVLNSDDDSGCGCRVRSERAQLGATGLALLAAAGLLRRRAARR